MRIASIRSAFLALAVTACVSALQAGNLEPDSSLKPKIVAVDTARPPRNIFAQLDRDGYAAVILVIPGHSATLLYPADSATDNRLTAGSHQLPFEIPSHLTRDSLRLIMPRNPSRRVDTTRVRTGRIVNMAPVPDNAHVYLLLLTATQPLTYGRIMDKTAGVSIPLLDDEALNAITKAVKATLPVEPREIGAYFTEIDLTHR